MHDRNLAVFVARRDGRASAPVPSFPSRVNWAAATRKSTPGSPTPGCWPNLIRVGVALARDLRDLPALAPTTTPSAAPPAWSGEAGLATEATPGATLREVALAYRISSAPGKSETTVLVEGHLSAAGARDLESEVQRARGPVHLDVAGLRSASPDGVQALRSFSDRGGKIVGASPFILLLLATASAIGEEG